MKNLVMMPIFIVAMVTVTIPPLLQQAIAQGEGGCIEMEASDIGEGWTRLVCEGEPDRFFSPSGDECYFNNNRTGGFCTATN